MGTVNTEATVGRRTSRTFEGAPARKTTGMEELRRAALSCLMWENTFYESGSDLAERLANCVPRVDPEELGGFIVDLRTEYNLRHVPLFLVTEMCKYDSHKEYVRRIIQLMVTRPDDVTELLAMWWKDGKKPLSMQLKRGIADVLGNFTEYQLGKYQNKGAIKLVDVFNVVHPKPPSATHKKLWKKFIDGKIATPDTWEVELSKNGNSGAAWMRLIDEKKLGGLATLRNLRNMQNVFVGDDYIRKAIAQANYSRVLPFRFVAAARHAPKFEPELEKQMFGVLTEQKKLEGRTKLLVDVSASMNWDLSSKSDMNRLNAACALAMILREICYEVEVVTFSNNVAHVPSRHGFALRDAIINSQHHGGTHLGAAVRKMNQQQQHNRYDRLIVFTDEQSSDYVPGPDFDKAYMVNVATNQNSVTFGSWVSVNGFSEKIVDFIHEYEDPEKA